MTPEQLKRGKEIELRLNILARQRDWLEKSPPVVCARMDRNMLGEYTPLNLSKSVLPTNFTAVCLDAIATEEAVLRQELAAL